MSLQSSSRPYNPFQFAYKSSTRKGGEKLSIGNFSQPTMNHQEAQNTEQPKTPDSPKPQTSQNPDQPKTPNNPKPRTTQNPEQPKTLDNPKPWTTQNPGSNPLARARPRSTRPEGGARFQKNF